MTTLSDLWTAFPSRITDYLGHQASGTTWEQHLALRPLADLSPTWQVVQAGTDQASTVWGLQSLTLHTPAAGEDEAWPGRWPEQLPGQHAGIEHFRTCFGEPLLHERQLAIFQTSGPHERTWAVQCMFTSTGQLHSLTIVRMHDWEVLQPLPQQDTTPAAAEALQADVSLAASAAASPAPRTGWYQAQLPAEHAMQAFFANSDMSLVFRREGERFPSLGVTPREDEALVQWHWLRAD